MGSKFHRIYRTELQFDSKYFRLLDFSALLGQTTLEQTDPIKRSQLYNIYIIRIPYIIISGNLCGRKFPCKIHFVGRGLERVPMKILLHQKFLYGNNFTRTSHHWRVPFVLWLKEAQ